jgi:histidinol-phosphate phosphatase family protein
MHEFPVVFLDRDGTINVDTGYLSNPEQVELIDGAAWAVAELKRRGYYLVVVSNQSAIGRGYTTVDKVEATNERLKQLLIAEDKHAVIDRIVYCPHSPEDRCECRKPGLGMLDYLGCDFKFTPVLSWVIGDKMSDLAFGEKLGVPFEQRLLVGTGEGAKQIEELRARAAALPRYFASLREAVIDGVLGAVVAESGEGSTNQ